MNKKVVINLIHQLLSEFGEDVNREGLKDTPTRVANAYEELLNGYEMNSELEIVFSESSDMCIAPNIEFNSLCEHHLLPFSGVVHIAYIPDGKVTGLSKLTRLVDKYSHRLQIQERMVKQIADELYEKLKAVGVMVVVNAVHTCVKCRGVENTGQYINSAIRGAFMESFDLKEEALRLIELSK